MNARICSKSSPRLISTGQLNTLLCLHFRPINQMVFLEPYHLNGVGDLILGGASRLDAFSVYPVRTLATQLCPWQDNWCTRGTSIPVLSY